MADGTTGRRDIDDPLRRARAREADIDATRHDKVWDDDVIKR
jgi:hypothetical protein